MSEYIADHVYFRENVVLQVAAKSRVVEPFDGFLEAKASPNNNSISKHLTKESGGATESGRDRSFENDVYAGDMTSAKQHSMIDYTVRINGMAVDDASVKEALIKEALIKEALVQNTSIKKTSLKKRVGLETEPTFRLKINELATLAHNKSGIAIQMKLPRVSLQTSRAEALNFPENTNVGSFLTDFEVRVSGFDNKDDLQGIAIKYLYEFSRRFEKGSGKPFYQGKSFNVTLPINNRNDMGHFNFEFSADNSQAAIRYYGNASLESYLGKPGGTSWGVIRRLKHDFGVGEVINGTAKWTYSELTKVYTAFAMLPHHDRQVLHRMVLEKVVKIPNDIEDIHTLAHFKSVVSPMSDEVLTRKVVVSNKAFEDDVASEGKAATFTLNREEQVIPMSIQTILHEVGHGIEKLTMLQRAMEHANAVKLRNAEVLVHNKRVQELNKAAKNQKLAVDDWQRLRDLSIKNLQIQADLIEQNQGHDSYSGVVDRINQINKIVLELVNTHTPDQSKIKQVRKALEDTRIKAVISLGKKVIQFKLNAWQGKLSYGYSEKNSQLWEGFQQAGVETIRQAESIFSLHQQQRNNIIAKINSLIEFSNETFRLIDAGRFDVIPQIPQKLSEFKLKKTIRRLFSASKVVDSKQREINESDKFLRNLALNNERLERALKGVSNERYGTNRLQNFVKFVKDKEVQPTTENPLTDYALRSWGENKPGEYFAESYSLFLTNYQFLFRYKPEVYHYFDNQVYREDKILSAFTTN